MKIPNPIKRLGRWAWLVAMWFVGLLTERTLDLFVPSDITSGITLLLGIPPGIIILGGMAIATGGFCVWAWRNPGPDAHVFFGGYRLRRLEPLVMQCLSFTEADFAEQWYPKLNAHLTAKRLTESLDELRIPHPPLLVDRQDPEGLRRALVFLHQLRRRSAEGDLKKARQIAPSFNLKPVNNS